MSATISTGLNLTACSVSIRSPGGRSPPRASGLREFRRLRPYSDAADRFVVVRFRPDAFARDYRRETVGMEKPNVSPSVNCQSGAARLMPCRTPASRNAFLDVGCQMRPSSAELFGRALWV